MVCFVHGFGGSQPWQLGSTGLRRASCGWELMVVAIHLLDNKQRKCVQEQARMTPKDTLPVTDFLQLSLNYLSHIPILPSIHVLIRG